MASLGDDRDGEPVHTELQVSTNFEFSFPQESNSTMTLPDKEYEFFVTTDEPHQPEGTDRGLIRRLVMRNFFDTKGEAPQNNVCENNSASTVMAKKQLKSRFRLSKVGQETAETTGKKKSCKDGSGTTKKKKRPKALKKLSGFSDTGGAMDSPTSFGSSPAGYLTDEEHYGSRKDMDKRRDPRIVFKISLSAHSFDPFDVLPVPGTPQLDTLFKLYKSGSKKNSITSNPKNTWWSFISNDAGLLHATLATWALYGMLVQGLNYLRVDKLKHKNEAIKEINVKIGSPGGKISDELVGTVLTMASFENLMGDYDSAQLHVTALKRMVDARGGLSAFAHNDGLIRGIAWLDFHTATAFRTPPSFPRIPLDPDSPPLPDKLLEEAACTSPTTLLQLSVAGVECFNIFYRLHRLGIAVSGEWSGKVDRLTLSNLLYEVEFIVLSVPDHSRTFFDFDQEVASEKDAGFERRESAANAASVVEALLAASQIFIFAALRDVPSNAAIFVILLERMRVALDRPSVRAIDVWKHERNINMLLWSLIVACCVAGEGREWWFEQIMDVLGEIGIESREGFEGCMRGVACVEGWDGVGGGLRGIWGEVEKRRRRIEMSGVEGMSEEREEARWMNEGWYV